MDERRISLAEAARRTGIPEERLRRLVLLGELDAQPADDDRQYLLSVEDVERLRPPVPCAAPPPPSPRAWPTLLVSASLAAVLLGALTCFSVFSLRSTCVDCTKVMRTVTFADAIVLSRELEDGTHTELIREASDGGCAHRWVLVEGTSGGILEIRGPGLARERKLLNLERLGVVEAARRVDVQGAAELVRLTLRRELPFSGREWIDRGRKFLSADDFKSWLADLRERAVLR